MTDPSKITIACSKQLSRRLKEKHFLHCKILVLHQNLQYDIMTMQQAIDNNDNVQSYSCRNVKCAKYYKDVENTIQDMEYFFTTVCSCNFCT